MGGPKAASGVGGTEHRGKKSLRPFDNPKKKKKQIEKVRALSFASCCANLRRGMGASLVRLFVQST